MLHPKPPPAAALSARNTAAITSDTDTGFKLSMKNKLISQRSINDSSLFSELNCYQHNSYSPPILILVATDSLLLQELLELDTPETVPPAAALLLPMELLELDTTVLG